MDSWLPVRRYNDNNQGHNDHHQGCDNDYSRHHDHHQGWHNNYSSNYYYHQGNHHNHRRFFLPSVRSRYDLCKRCDSDQCRRRLCMRRVGLVFWRRFGV